MPCITVWVTKFRTPTVKQGECFVYILHFNPLNYNGHCMCFVQFSQQTAIIIFLVAGGGTLTFHAATASKQANVHNFYIPLLLSTYL